jgi:hypothetical protein
MALRGDKRLQEIPEAFSFVSVKDKFKHTSSVLFQQKLLLINEP